MGCGPPSSSRRVWLPSSAWRPTRRRHSSPWRAAAWRRLPVPPPLLTLPAPESFTARELKILRLVALGLAMKSYKLSPGALTVIEPELWIYDSDLLGAPGLQRPTLVWRMDVESAANDVRELVLVDAKLGTVALHFNQVADARDRRVCDNNSTIGVSDACTADRYVRVEGQGPTGNADIDQVYDYTGNTYDFYKNRFGRDSLDAKGMALFSTVRYCPDYFNCPFQNAYWNGKQMVYGQGVGADDVDGHELTHGVTQYESGLFYYYQSGAINESLSDVFGELIDLTNGRGDDSTYVRWDIAEDSSLGTIRNMMDPTFYLNPDKMTSYFYVTGDSDNGGVHSNSGVNNKAAALMVDGGSFNGKTITGLGIDKTAKIYYEVETNLLTSGSDYQDLYNALQQACANLVGSGGITSTDCQQVKNTVDATEMNIPAPAGDSSADGRAARKPASSSTSIQSKEVCMGAPSPELVDLWLARAFNAQDVEAAAAMYHPDARVVRLQHVHGTDFAVQGADEIRETMAGYVGLKPHMDVIVQHTTVAGDFALCRSQGRITGRDQHGAPIDIQHHAMEVMRRLENGE
jgi:ketosteroid isomerase-like protein